MLDVAQINEHLAEIFQANGQQRTVGEGGSTNSGNESPDDGDAKLGAFDASGTDGEQRPRSRRRKEPHPRIADEKTGDREKNRLDQEDVRIG